MPKVAEEWLNICGGCEVAILDIGEKLLDLLPSLEFVHMPVLMDHKYFGQTGEKSELEIPEADIGMISGGIRNEKEKHVAEEMRKKCNTLIALGACACHGGIPALANMYTLDDLYEKVYRDSKTTESADTPSRDLPALTDRVYALDEVVPVDVYIPGCPMNPVIIVEALTCLLEGKPFELPERSVCDDCAVRREEKSDVGLRRPLQDAEFKRIIPGQGEILRTGGDVTLLAIGATVYPALEAAELLAKEDIECTVINSRFAKPLDSKLILDSASATNKLVTIEENALSGGFGSAVLELLENSELAGVETECIGLPDKFIEHGTQEVLRSMFDLDSAGIARRVINSFPELSGRISRKQRESVGQ